VILLFLSLYLGADMAWSNAYHLRGHKGRDSTSQHVIQPKLIATNNKRSQAKDRTDAPDSKQSTTQAVSAAAPKTSNDILILTPPSVQPGEEINAISAALHAEGGQADKQELDRIARQMAADPIPIPRHLGGIFVPNIIKREDVRPTEYVVYDELNRPVSIAYTGRKSFVKPGEYTVKIGRKATDLLPTYRIRVIEGRMTVILPRWAALVIRVVDERLIQFRGTYDIIHLRSRRGIGTGIGADDTIGEKVLPWLIPPGLYMIVRVGSSYLTRTNFFTVQINQGEMTYFRLVMDRNTGQFLGGGVILREQIAPRLGGWSWSFQLSSNFLWNQIENVSGSSSGHSFSLTAFVFGRVMYDQDRHFFLSTLNMELGFTIPPQGIFRKSADRLELQSIYIFRVLPWFGPYIRGGIDTAIFPDTYILASDDLRFRQHSSVYHCQSSACNLFQQFNPNEMTAQQLSGFFDPLLFKEGLGVNLQAVRTSWLDLRLLFGFGFRQEIAREVFQFDSVADIGDQRCSDPSKRNPKNPLDLSQCAKPEEREQHTSLLLTIKPTSIRQGLEFAIVGTGYITRFVSFTFEIDALAQFTDFLNFDVNGRFSVTLRLSHYASLIYRLHIRRDPGLRSAVDSPEWGKWSIDQSIALSFSLLI
jgi:hypothetical protein